MPNETNSLEIWHHDLSKRVGHVEESLTDISTKITLLEKQDAVDGVHRQSVEKRLSSIEDTLKWLVRLIIGAIIMGTIGFALGGGFALVQ